MQSRSIPAGSSAEGSAVIWAEWKRKGVSSIVARAMWDSRGYATQKGEEHAEHLPRGQRFPDFPGFHQRRQQHRPDETVEMGVQSPRGYPSLRVRVPRFPDLDEPSRGSEGGRAVGGAAKPGGVMGKQEVLEHGGVVEPGGSRGFQPGEADVGSGGSELFRGEGREREGGKEAEGAAVGAERGRERELEQRLVEVAVEPGEVEGKGGKRPGKEREQRGQVERALVQVGPVLEVAGREAALRVSDLKGRKKVRG